MSFSTGRDSTRFYWRRRRQVHRRYSYWCDLPKYSPAFIDDAEFILKTAQRFARAKKHDTGALEAEIKQGEDFFFRLSLQINQQIAAANEIQFRKRCVLQNVVLGKHNLLPQLRTYLIAAFDFREISFNALGAYMGQTSLFVNASAGNVDAFGVNVGGKNLYVQRVVSFL